MSPRSLSSRGRRLHSIDTPDPCLVEAARGGDERAYQLLYQRHHQRALAHAHRLGFRGADAEDVVAQAFASTFRRLQQGGGPAQELLPYLYVAIRNAVVHSVRMRHARVTLVPTADMDVDHLQEPSEHGTDDADHDELWSAFNSLSRRWQDVLWLTEVEGVTARQLAPALGVSPNAVAALSMRARQGLRSALASTRAS